MFCSDDKIKNIKYEQIEKGKAKLMKKFDVLKNDKNANTLMIVFLSAGII